MIGSAVLATLPLLLAPDNPAWTEPHPPFRIAGDLYYVGSKDLASYLIVTPQGHILINSGLEASVPLVRASVEALGFDFAEIEVLLISHAHFDHCAIVIEPACARMLRQGAEGFDEGEFGGQRTALATASSTPLTNCVSRLSKKAWATSRYSAITAPVGTSARASSS